jgi:hypothetical protein
MIEYFSQNSYTHQILVQTLVLVLSDIYFKNWKFRSKEVLTNIN